MFDEKKIREYVKTAHEIAVKHGFHQEPRSDMHWLCLIISEVMEAMEADRKSHRAQRKMFEANFNTKQAVGHVIEHRMFVFNQFIKDSVEDEIADAAIRIIDFIGEKFGDSITYEGEGIRKMYLEGTFTEMAYNFIYYVLGPGEAQLTDSIDFLYAWADKLDFDLDWHIEQKMKYNRFRPKLNGKQY